jgi:hypothetical protein
VVAFLVSTKSYEEAFEEEALLSFLGYEVFLTGGFPIKNLAFGGLAVGALSYLTPNPVNLVFVVKLVVSAGTNPFLSDLLISMLL